MDEELKRILIQLMEGQEALKLGQEGLIAGQEKLDKRLSKLEVKFEAMDSRLKQMAEIQAAHYEENQRQHKEMTEMLSNRLDLQDSVIKNLKVAN